jgi:hypothetical protein
MKLKFKINLKKSKIPERIKVPKTLIEGRLLKSKLPNFVEKEYLKETFNFEYDKKNKILTSTDNHPKVIHGIYSRLNLKLVKEAHKGMYTHGWFTGFEGRFVGHDFLFRHFVTFDEFQDDFVLVNKVGYFFRKDGDDDFTLPGKEDESGAYVWMDLIK